MDSVPPATTALGVAQHDALGAVGNRRNPDKKAVDGDRRCLHRNPRPQAGDPRDVQPLLAFRHRAAEDDVVDQRGVETARPSSASLITTAPISSGRTRLRGPRGAFPTAVRTAETMTASSITRHS